MKTSTGFKKAKKYLSNAQTDGKSRFICHALLSAGCHNLKLIIQSRLNSRQTALIWLRENIGDNAVDAATYEQIQAWRHAWLDQLIEEFKAKGD